MRYNLEIDSEILPKFLEWKEKRGGVLVWENLEIGSSAAREVFTPATTESGEDGTKFPPSWRYGNPELVDFDSLLVGTFTKLESFDGRVKKFYWGMGLSEATEKKAERLCELRRLMSPSSKFEYRYTFDYTYGRSFARIEIGEIVRESFRELQAV